MEAVVAVADPRGALLALPEDEPDEVDEAPFGLRPASFEIGIERIPSCRMICRSPAYDLVRAWRSFTPP